MEPDSVDLVFGSPPYEDARTYGIDFKLKGQDWVDWMVDVYRASLRVSKGLVAFVVQGKTRKFRCPQLRLCLWQTYIAPIFIFEIVCSTIGLVFPAVVAQIGCGMMLNILYAPLTAGNYCGATIK
jgi:hypothetical protein